MLEQSIGWSVYYRETDPEKRLAMLEELLEKETDDGANAYRKRLADLRYGVSPDTGARTDMLLWQCVNFSQIYSSSRFFKGMGRKEVRQALEQLGYDEASSYGEAGESALYWELRNGARRYFQTCMGADYRRMLFGLMSSGEESKKEQMCKDAWHMSGGLSARLGLEDYMQLWTKAVQDEYFSCDPAGRQRYARLEGKHI